VNHPTVAALSDAASLLCVILILLIPFAGAGLALINAGLGRSRSAAHAMMSSLCVLAVAALAYFVCGFAWQGIAGQQAHVLAVGNKAWSWIGSGPFFLGHLSLDGSPAPLVALFGMLGASLAALIPLGSGADRWRLGACCASAAILAGWTYPLFAHWAWGGGWLAQLGANYGLGRGFVDTGGAGTIQAVGGLTALSIAWIVGARRGKYTREGIPNAIPGHNSVLVLFGCMLALVGWWGLNSAGAVLFIGTAPGQVALVAINTILAAGASALAAAAITHARFGKPDASLTANGWIGGLAASSGACALVAPVEAVVIGVAAGALVTFAVEWIELRMAVDDPGGAISAHAMGGLWGVLSVGLFARIPARELNAAGQSAMGHSGQWLAQLVGIATLIGFVLPLTYGLNWLVNRFYAYRVAAEGERQGLDLYELGAGAYPEFIVHNDEFTER
jgi:ammonium transporter, Amt family